MRVDEFARLMNTNCLRRARIWALCGSLFVMSACASVPQEAVELSYLIGRDMAALQQSYDLLLEQRFEDYRAQRTDYLENIWAPAFIAEWLKDGRLIDTARGVVVYDESQDEFVAPTPGREQQQLLSTIYGWSDAAIFEINDKRASLLDPLDEQERQIRREARAAFDQLIQANAYVTAHLNSIREVQDLQTQALDALGLEDVVSSLNESLVKVSNSARDGLDAIQKADGYVDRAIEIRSEIEDNR